MKVIERIAEYKGQTIVIKNEDGVRTFHLGNILFASMRAAKEFIDRWNRRK